MGKKQFIILIVILALVAAVAVAVRSSRTSNVRASMKGVGEKVFPDFPINQIAEVSITGADGTQTLTRKEGEEGNVWSLKERGDYPADFSKVSDLLRELWGLKIAQNIEAGPSQFGRLGLIAPDGGEDAGKKAGTLMEFKGGDGEVLASLLVGNAYTRQSETPSPFGGSGEVPAGRYLKAGGTDEVWLVSETLDGVDTTMENWLQKEFFKVEKLKTIERKSKDTKEDWKIAKESEDEDVWRLLLVREGEVLDDTKIASLKSAFSGPRFDDVVPGAKSAGEDATEFVLETFEGFTYKVAVGPELEGRKHHITVSVEADLPKERKAEEGESEEDKKTKDEEFKNEQERLETKLAKEKKLEGWVYLVPNYVASPLLKKRSEIIQGPAPAPGEGPDGGADASKVPMTPLAPLAPLAPPGEPGASPVPAPPAPVPPPAPAPAPAPPKGEESSSSKPGAATPQATAVTEPIEINLGKPEKAGEAEKKAGNAVGAGEKKEK